MARIWIIALFVMVAGTRMALAAPFCLEGPGLPRQCIYTNTADCRDRAKALKVSCTVNPDEIKITADYGAFCTVNSERVVQCLYPDVASCNREAAKSDAICVINFAKTIETDPYRYTPERVK